MSYLTKKDSLLISFTNHLRVLGVSSNTLKNYRSDILFFSGWAKDRLKQDGIVAVAFSEMIPFLSPSLASEFKLFQSSNSQSRATVNRRLSALRTLSKFLVESQVLESDFMDQIANVGTVNESLGAHPVLGHFKKHLESQNVSKNTVKNYLSDVKHFLSWLETNQKHAAQPKQ